MNSVIDKKIIRGHMGKTVIFDSKEDQKLFMKDFLSQSSLQEKFSSWSIQKSMILKKLFSKKF